MTAIDVKGRNFMAFEITSKRRSGESGRDYAYRILRRNIMQFQLKPGDLLNEAELSEQLGMSRTPIHEALILLRNEELVDILPHRSSTVSYISLKYIREGCFMRQILESAMIEELAGTLSADQMEMFKENIKKQEEELALHVDKISDDFFELDDELHRLLHKFSHRERIWSAMHGLNAHYDRIRYLDTLVNAVDQMQILEQHKSLYYYLLMGIPFNVDVSKFIEMHQGRFLADFPKTVAAYPEYFVD